MYEIYGGRIQDLTNNRQRCEVFQTTLQHGILCFCWLFYSSTMVSAFYSVALSRRGQKKGKTLSKRELFRFRPVLIYRYSYSFWAFRLVSLTDPRNDLPACSCHVQTTCSCRRRQFGGSERDCENSLRHHKDIIGLRMGMQVQIEHVLRYVTCNVIRSCPCNQ